MEADQQAQVRCKLKIKYRKTKYKNHMKNERDYLNLAIAIGKLKSEDVKRAKRLGIDSRRLLGMVRSCEKEKWKLPAPLFLKYCEENRKGKISIKAFLKKEGLTKKDIIKAKMKSK